MGLLLEEEKQRRFRLLMREDRQRGVGLLLGEDRYIEWNGFR